MVEDCARLQEVVLREIVDRRPVCLQYFQSWRFLRVPIAEPCSAKGLRAAIGTRAAALRLLAGSESRRFLTTMQYFIRKLFMQISMRSMLLVAGLVGSAVCFAQAPSGAPANATGQCNDGTYTTSASKKGACSKHQGVKEWYGAASASGAGGAAASSEAATKSTAPAAAPAASAPAPAASAPAAPAAKTAPQPMAAAAPGGGPGQVWVNTKSKVYHCPGDRWYGKTKEGEYMTEAQASAKGFRPDHGKACK